MSVVSDSKVDAGDSEHNLSSDLSGLVKHSYLVVYNLYSNYRSEDSMALQDLKSPK